MPTTISGTQSPPLEATGEEVPMGASSVDRVGEKIPFVKDIDQRRQYFEPETEEDSQKREPQKGTKIMGESLSDKVDKMK
ncbi:hypothetical protein H0H92_013710 [Tricholoma furcatifolium]|nr:hypothetical protein H0H92_013710 [Tricholoma furcatifolium]